MPRYFISKKKNISAAKLAKKALKVAKRAEVESGFETAPFNLHLSQNPTFTYIQPPEAEGVKQTSKYIEGRFTIRPDQHASLTYAVGWRVDLILDRQPAMMPLDVNHMYGNIPNPEVSVLMPFYNKDRYKVVKSWSGILSGHAGTQGTSRYFKVRTGLKLEAVDPLFDFQHATKNAYYLVYWCDQTITGSQGVDANPIFQGQLQHVTITG